MLKASLKVILPLSIGFCLLSRQLTYEGNHLNSVRKSRVSTRPKNNNLRSLSAKVFSKFKLQKSANEREHPTDIQRLTVPLLEQLRVENEQLRSRTTAQYHELIKAQTEAFQFRTEKTSFLSLTDQREVFGKVTKHLVPRRENRYENWR